MTSQQPQHPGPSARTSAATPPGCERLVARLDVADELEEEDREALRGLCTDIRDVGAKRDIIKEGDRPAYVHILIEGWAARYNILPDGSRQIVAFLIPGDFCDLHVAGLAEMDHSILALTPASLAYVSPEVMDILPAQRPRVGRALRRAALIDKAVLRSWIVNLGRRDSTERIAHLFCELHTRLALVGLADDGHFDLPLTQEVIADAVGLTPVHVNRTLQAMRAGALIVLKSGELTITDIPRLRKLAGFDPRYLHRGVMTPG